MSFSSSTAQSLGLQREIVTVCLTADFRLTQVGKDSDAQEDGGG